jgi:1-acyl-sn-glycerol-3-phosphate acyltransferase
MIGKLRTACALIMVAAVTLVLAPVQYSALTFGFPRPSFVPKLWHRLALRALGLRVRVSGAMTPDRPLLIAANHVSWTDIMVIGSIFEVSFIAKSEVAGWPGAGWLARMQRSVFVERERRGKSRDQASEIGTRLAHGDVMVLFAEGGTCDGNQTGPFKSTLFGAATMAMKDNDIPRVVVQPLAIAYTRLHGMPMHRIHRPLAAWIGESDLFPHIKALLAEGGMDVELRLGEPFEFSRTGNRKDISARAERQVRDLHAAALRNPA